MNIKKRTKIWLVIFSIMLIVAALSFYKVMAQDQNTQDIYLRLINLDVPVISVNTVSQLPYKIEIVLQSESETEQLVPSDNWNMVLAHREATLAFRVGIHLNSYDLEILNNDGNLISSTQTYLYKGDINQQLTETAPTIDNHSAKEIIKQQLDLSELKLYFLDVFSNQENGSNGQILLVELSAKDIQTANRSLPIFLESFFRLLETSNDANGTYLVLCHLRLLDETGVILLDYVKDLESGASQWKLTEGLYSDWFPHPEFEKNVEPSPDATRGYPAPPAIISSTQELDKAYP